MNVLTLIILVLLLITMAFFLFRKKPVGNSAKDLEVSKMASFNPNDGGEEVPWKQSSDLNISQEEKVELSWSFLYEITDFVLQHFSAEDKQELKEIGEILQSGGMNYQHVVEYGITKAGLAAKKSKEDTKNQIV